MKERIKYTIEEKVRRLLAECPICQICNLLPSEEIHHLFEQSKFNKELYPEFIHDRKNLLCLCKSCHEKHGYHIDEKTFCSMFNIEPRSKSGLWKAHRASITLL
jgi:5-methylcytosine-specific restriction endonuclease McrA